MCKTSNMFQAIKSAIGNLHHFPLQENCVLDSAGKWMLKGKLWMLIAF